MCTNTYTLQEQQESKASNPNEGPSDPWTIWREALTLNETNRPHTPATYITMPTTHLSVKPGGGPAGVMLSTDAVKVNDRGAGLPL